jgi:hypothetical protein
MPFHKVVVWNDLPKEYISWESYATGANRDKVLVGVQYEDRVKLYSKLMGCCHPDVQRAIPSLLVMVDYALAIASRAIKKDVGQSPEASAVVSHLIEQKGEPDTLVIRVQSGGVQDAFAHWLRMFLPLIGCDYEVLTPASGMKESFEQLAQGKRTICIVVEKGRLGDTIPHLSLMDLRARYRDGRTATLSSFIQDVGRCFGYRKKVPLILLSEVGGKLLRGGLETVRVDRYLMSDIAGGDIVVPAKESMWARVLQSDDETVIGHFKTRRALFLASPQTGKSGVYLMLIKMAMQSKRQ